MARQLQMLVREGCLLESIKFYTCSLLLPSLYPSYTATKMP